MYLADSLSMAVLEVLVHNDMDKDHIENAFVQFQVEIPEELLEDVVPPSKLPADWQINPPPQSTMDLGTHWLQSQRSVGLIVPSTVIEIQKNIIVNPNHPRYEQITIHDREQIRIDPRLVP